VPLTTPIKVDHVLIQDAPGFGISLNENSGFAPGSQALTITDTGKAPGFGPASGPYPMRIVLNGISTIPTGTYTGNGKDEIEIAGDDPNASLSIDATLPNRGVPYHVGGGGSNTDLRVASSGGAAVTLTIEAGVEIRFEKNGRLGIGRYTGDQPPIGVLIAVGTRSQPIVFTSAAATPAPGDWAGLRFTETLSPNNLLEYVIVRYAGGDCGCANFSCGPTLMTGVADEAAILLFNHAPSKFIKNCTIEHSAAHGIGRGWTGTPDISFVADNNFVGVAGCFESYPRPKAGCPASVPCPR
jgi:hypothetical protein